MVNLIVKFLSKIQTSPQIIYVATTLAKNRYSFLRANTNLSATLWTSTIMANPPPPFATAIIHPQYCVPHTVDLIIKKERTFGDNFTVTDISDNVVFTVKGPLVTIVTPRKHRFLRDAYGNPIAHLRRAVIRPSNYSTPPSPFFFFFYFYFDYWVFFFFAFLLFSVCWYVFSVLNS